MPKILLVAPWRPLHTAPHIKSLVKALTAPADLATVAALTPKEFEVRIWDESVRGRIESSSQLREQYDIIGIGGYSADFQRVSALAAVFRERSIPLVAGGVGVSSEPQAYRSSFDVLFIGEAEYTWPRFLSDFKTGSYQSEYRQVSRVDMNDSPPPRWDVIASDIGSYGQTVVQTTRGCPFDCEFCDVISLFGRLPRHKSIEQVLEEVKTLSSLGATSVAIADDNIYGDKNYAKALLPRLAELNASFDRPLKFWTQITLNASKDDEMLRLLSDANVQTLLIGIETPNVESLVETNKPQNYKLDLRSAIRKIQGYGFRIEASLIVGFDHDDESIFQQQFDFIQEACLVPVFIWTLAAIPGTKLWMRLHAENRVFEKARSEGQATVMVHQHNVVPKLMSLDRLLSGYADLLRRVHDWGAFERRLEGLLERIDSVPPLMLRMPSMTKWRALTFIGSNIMSSTGRPSLLGLMGDPNVQRIKKRLRARYPGDSERERYLRALIESAVDEEFSKINYEIPVVLRMLEEDRARLAREGLPRLEGAVFSIPAAFRYPYKSMFPRLHAHVAESLRNTSHVEEVLSEIIYDFLARWGADFERFEPHHGVNMLEISARTIARHNDQVGEIPSSNLDPIELASGSDRIADVGLRKLSEDVLRSVELSFRRRTANAEASGSSGLVRLRVGRGDNGRRTRAFSE